MILKWILAGILIGHGLAHISGFLAAWTTANVGYGEGTWLFSSGVTMRSTPGRVTSLFWLLAVVCFVSAAVGLVTGVMGWTSLAVVGAAASLIAIVPWWGVIPLGAKIGVGFDLVLLVILLTPLRQVILSVVS